MAASRCPICYYAPLEDREVSPCFDCGWDRNELAHLADGRHSYDEVKVFGEVIVLCNFCQADFWNYKPGYFNREADVKPGKDMSFRQSISDPKSAKDKFCPECCARLAFLRFLERVRAARGR